MGDGTVEASQIVLLSAVLHAIWNFAARAVKGDETVVILGTAGAK